MWAIGLNTPQSRLHLHNVTTPTITTEQSIYEQYTVDGSSNGTGNGPGDGFKVGVRSFWNGTTFQSNAELRQQEASPMTFLTFNTERMRIVDGTNTANDGNIGINTTITNLVGNAQRAVTIATDIPEESSNALEMWMNSDAAPSGLTMGAVRFFAGSSVRRQNSIIASRISGNNDGGDLSFWTRQTSFPNPTERVTITSVGNVGIGTSFPASQLHVIGAARLGRGFSDNGTLIYNNSSNGNTVTVQSGATSTSYTLTLPAAQGAANTFLKNDGSGNLSWDAGTGGGGGTPAPPNTSVQFNNNGAFGGSGNFVWDGTNVGIGTTSPTSKLHITGTGSDPSAGSLRISDSNGSPILQARNDGKVSFGSADNVPAAKYEFTNTASNPTRFDRAMQVEHTALNGNHPAVVINCNDNGLGNTTGLSIVGSFTGLNSGALSVTGNAFIGESGGNISGTLLRMTSNTKQYGINLTQSASLPSESSYGIFVVNSSTGGSSCCGTSPQYNYGVFAQMSASTAPAGAMVAARFDSPDYAIYVPQSKGRVSIGYTPASSNVNCLLDVNGNICANGYVTNSSDIQLKKDTSSFTSGLETIRMIRPVFYNYNGKAGITSNKKPLVGIIAQQLLSVAPYAIDTFYAKIDTADTEETLLLTVSNEPLLYAAINAIKQLDSVIAASNSVIAQQQQAIANLQNCVNEQLGCGATSKKANPDDRKGEKESQQINLESSGAAILYQNEPNPFGNSTVIRYYVPESAGEAMLVFYDEFGREISKEILTGKGYSKVDVNAEKLAAGIYTYSIIVDGKIADTKKMIRSK